jgi:hypothetical protein
MDFEVLFLVNGKEVARYQFPVETPSDFQAGVVNAIETFRVAHPEIDLLGDGFVMRIQRVGR